MGQASCRVGMPSAVSGAMDRRYRIRLSDQGFHVSCAEFGIEALGNTIEGAIAELTRALAARNEVAPKADKPKRRGALAG